MPTDPTHGPIPTHGELFVVVSWRHTQQAFLTCREILLLLGNHTQRVFGDTQPEFFLCIFIGDLHLLPLLIAIGNTCRNLLNLVVVAHLQTRSSSSSNCPTYGSIALHQQHMLEFLSKLRFFVNSLDPAHRSTSFFRTTHVHFLLDRMNPCSLHLVSIGTSSPSSS